MLKFDKTSISVFFLKPVFFLKSLLFKITWEILFSYEKKLSHNMLKLATQKVTLDRVKIQGCIHKLSRGLEITIEPDDENLVLSNEEFGLLVSVPTLEEGISGISEELNILFEVYAYENPENLTADALILKKNLQSLVPVGAMT